MLHNQVEAVAIVSYCFVMTFCTKKGGSSTITEMYASLMNASPLRFLSYRVSFIPFVSLVLRIEAQWQSGSVFRFHATGPGLKSRVGQGRLSFNPFSGSILSTKLAWELNTGDFSHQTDHLTEKSAHVHQSLKLRILR
ncbi:hypothetical protein TNCV_3332151 [Trichonephila clavipes]|nr:hypothetical protein TNCV_3332151 [Trichonephila clavipes]